jgi:hypothetical protein
MSAQVDVLAVMDDLRRGCRLYADSEGRQNRNNYADDLLCRRYDEARSAFVELIEAANCAYPPGDYSQDAHGFAVRKALDNLRPSA